MTFEVISSRYSHSNLVSIGMFRHVCKLIRSVKIERTGSCFLTTIRYNPKLVMSEFVKSGIDCIYKKLIFQYCVLSSTYKNCS